MNNLFEVTQFDKNFYNKYINDFIPNKIIDIHTHIWLDEFKRNTVDMPKRAVTWPSLVANENSIEDLMETYQLLFPGKDVTPMIFSQVSTDVDVNLCNRYVQECGKRYHFPALMLARPWQTALEFKNAIDGGNFLGCKVYLNFAPVEIPEKEIEIFDFLPPHQLEVLSRREMIVMLHIPRDRRLRDEVNLTQLLEIENKYPGVKLIVAHVGRAYCDEDVGNSFDVLSKTRNMMFDISANTNSNVFQQLIKAVGPKRILFGSDLPILRMKTKRIYETGMYINLVPKGLYGNVSKDKNMREIQAPESENITFFLYEEIHAFLIAASKVGLDKNDIDDIFYNNAFELIKSTERG